MAASEGNDREAPERNAAELVGPPFLGFLLSMSIGARSMTPAGPTRQGRTASSIVPDAPALQR